MNEVDCLGLSCPMPVVMTKKELKKNPEGAIVLVDNVAAKENVTRFAKTMGYSVSIEEAENGSWKLRIEK